MAQRITIQIFADGRVQASTHGIKGKKCVEYIRVLEAILEAQTVDSNYKPEYYESEEVQLDNIQRQQIKEG